MNPTLNNISFGSITKPAPQNQSVGVPTQPLAPIQGLQGQMFNSAPKVSTKPVSSVSSYSPRFVGDTGSAQDDKAFAFSQSMLPSTPKITPQSYNVPTNTATYPSSVLSGQSNANTLQNTYNNKTQDLMNGTNNNLVPSDSLYGQVANKIFQTSQYTPEESQQLQNYADLNSRITATQLADRRQIKQLQEDGQLTKEQAAGFISESQRRADAQLADLAVAQTASSNTLDVLGKIRGNQLTAYQNLSSMLKPEQVSPGSTLYNPITGNMYQGNGASPQTIVSTAQNLKQNDQMTGQLRLTPQGTVDDNYYYQQAQQLYSTQGGTVDGQSGGMSGGQSYGTGQTGQIPQQVQTYLQASGGQYINSEKVPADQLNLVKTLASQNGVPVLTGDEVSKMRSIDVTQNNLQQLQGVTSQILGSGLTGRTIGALWNSISSGLQLNPNISSFNAYRDTAINTIQALAGGTGSGFRLNQGEINTAVGNLPTINDNLETAQKKISLVSGFLEKWKTELLQGNQGTSSGSQSSGGTVQTKAGVINTNW